MPTIAEILAAKAAGATVAKKSPESAAPRESLAEKAATKEAIDRIDPPGKRARASATGLVLNKDMPVPPRENRGQATPVTGPEERALSVTAGEVIDMTPSDADPLTAAWHQAAAGLESDLCVMRDPADPEACWLALRPKSGPHKPLLLHRLPWLLWEHPQDDAF